MLISLNPRIAPVSYIEYLTGDRIRPYMVSLLNYVPDRIQLPLPVGHESTMWLRLTPAELRYVIPDKEGGVEDAVIDHLSPGDCFIDCGAHLGYYSLLAKRCVGRSGRVVAFEPYLDHADRLKRNARWNNLDLTVENLAISDRTETMELRVADRAGGHALSTNDEGTGIKVQTTTIDRYLREGGLVPDLIKIDIEGTEIQALKGADYTLTECRPRLICELHPGRITNFDDSLVEFYRILRAHDYRVLGLPSGRQLSESTFVDRATQGSVNAFGMDTHLHILAEPADRASS